MAAASARRLTVEINRTIENTGQLRREVLTGVLLNGESKASRIGQAFIKAANAMDLGKRCRSMVKRDEALGREAERLEDRRLERLRPVPSLHILTTESAGMTEGYVQSWIEEEMALYKGELQDLQKLVKKIISYKESDEDIENIKEEILYASNQLDKSKNAKRYKKDKHTNSKFDEWD